LYIFQFQADILDAHPPIVLDMAEAITEYSSTARPAYETVGKMPGQWDHWGTRHAAFDATELSVTGQMYCRTTGGHREPLERMARRQTGAKGWLIAYRFERCCCEVCGTECICGNGFTRGYPPTWYAAPARLMAAEIADTRGRSYLDNVEGASPRLIFMVERPWEKITPDLWVYGDLKHPNLNTSQLHLGVDNQNEAEIFNYRHWPMRLTKAPSHGFWWRRPLEWMEDFPWLYETCVGHWSAGGWQRGYIGTLIYTPSGAIQKQNDPGVNYLYNPGDWPALCRLAFANFTWLRVRLLHKGVQQVEIEITEPTSSPQYLYVDTSNGELSVRYCPVSDDPCVDLSEYARFVPEASGVTPASVKVFGNLIGCIQPGLTRMEISGFRMPGLPFSWSYDLTPLYS